MLQDRYGLAISTDSGDARDAYDHSALGQYVDCLDRMGCDAQLPAGTVPAELAKAFGAFVRGDWSAVITRIEPIAGLARI